MKIETAEEKRFEGEQHFSDFKNPFVRDNLEIDWNKKPEIMGQQYREYETNLKMKLENSYGILYSNII